MYHVLSLARWLLATGILLSAQLQATTISAQKVPGDPGGQALRTFIKIINVSGIDLQVSGRRGWEYSKGWSDWGINGIAKAGSPKYPTVTYIQTLLNLPDGYVRCLKIAPAATEYNARLGVAPSIQNGTMIPGNGPRTVYIMHENGQPWWFKIKVDALFVDTAHLAQAKSSDRMQVLQELFGGTITSMLPKVLEPVEPNITLKDMLDSMSNRQAINSPLSAHNQQISDFAAAIKAKRPSDPNQYAVVSGFTITADEEDPGLKMYCDTKDINDEGIDKGKSTEFVTQWADPLIEGAVRQSDIAQNQSTAAA